MLTSCGGSGSSSTANPVTPTPAPTESVSFAYVTFIDLFNQNSAFDVASYSVESDGILANGVALAANYYSVPAFNNNYAYIASESSILAYYKVNESGALTFVANIEAPGISSWQPLNVVFNNNYAYIIDQKFFGQTAGHLWQYSVDQATGNLTSVAEVSQPSFESEWSPAAISFNNNQAYIVEQNVDQIWQYSVDSQTGSLTYVESVSVESSYHSFLFSPIFYNDKAYISGGDFGLNQYAVETNGELDNPQSITISGVPPSIGDVLILGLSAINNNYAYAITASASFGQTYKILIFQLDSTGLIFNYVDMLTVPSSITDQFVGLYVSFFTAQESN